MPRIGRAATSRSARASRNVGITSFATKLAASPASSEIAIAIASKHDARRRNRIRRHARRIDDAELRAAGVLHAHAHRRGLPPCKERLVGLFLDVVVAVELRVFRLGLRDQPCRSLQLCELPLVGVELRPQRSDVGFGIGKRDLHLLIHGIGVGGVRGFAGMPRRPSAVPRPPVVRCSSSCFITRRVPTTSGCSSV